MFSIRRIPSLLKGAAKSAVANSNSSRMKHALPCLPYAPNALEPVICCEIMELHHQKHHAAYVNNLNAAEERLCEAMKCGDVDTIISLGPALKFNGGGHLNHSIFWMNLSPCGGCPCDELMCAICDSFGSYDEMRTKMMTMTNSIQGSGWGWLGYNPFSCKLQLAVCKNQDPLHATTGLIPLFGIDVWEHAYYLQYRNARAEYTKQIFEIINWNDVNQRYMDAKCGVKRQV